MTRAIHSISNFLFEENTIRADIDGETPWFVAKDIAAALGIEWRGNSTLARIKSDWKGVRKFRTPGGNQELTVINEPAVYKFVFRSNKAEADRFTDWLAGEVLPAIRKDGSYTSGKPVHVREHDRRTSTKVDDAIRLKKNIDRLETVVASIQPQAPNFCAMVIDGEHVFVDTNRFYGVGRAVVIGADDRMRIEYVDTSGSHGLSRSTFGPWYSKGRGKARDGLIVVGMVMEPAMTAAPVVDAVRHEITSLLEAGPFTDQQIARRLICAPSLVRDVRMEHSMRNRNFGLAISG